MSDPILIVNTNPLLNLIHQNTLKLSAINRVQHLDVHAEGKGVNVARTLVRLGHSVTLTGFAGGHSGAWLQDIVRAEGIHESFIPTRAPLRMGFMASSAMEAHPTTILPNGFDVDLDEVDQLLTVSKVLIRDARLLIISGSVPHPTVASAYPELLAISQAAGVPTWLDAHGVGLRAALEGRVLPVLAKPNREELQEIENWAGVAELHITNGSAPTEVRSNSEGHWRVVPPSVQEINPVGCGDCYLAGLAHGTLKGWSFEARLRFAAAAGAANAQRSDVAMISPHDIESLLDHVRIDSLDPC